MLLASSARSQIYNVVEDLLWFFPSFLGFVLLLSPPSTPFFQLAQGEECYPVVAGQWAMRRQAITQAGQENDAKKKRAPNQS